ncbi:hypothetical protein SteCoe_25021 [Stentor coeruleus]|uniref:Uncharacterized protein n=1 Tax=Stentor coeruleus TaxID=5963 RepID=A0A1R2BG48_9CILI|nr:hypothetical protein SteCoe_25021 [Stentor coeruleus]
MSIDFELTKFENKIRSMVLDLMSPGARRMMEIQETLEELIRYNSHHSKRLDDLDFNFSTIQGKINLIDEVHKISQDLKAHTINFESEINQKIQIMTGNVSKAVHKVEDMSMKVITLEENFRSSRTEISEYTNTVSAVKSAIIEDQKELVKLIDKSVAETKKMWDINDRRLNKNEHAVLAFTDSALPHMLADVEKNSREIKEIRKELKDNLEKKMDVQDYQKLKRNLKYEHEKVQEKLKSLVDYNDKIEEYLDNYLPLERWNAISDAICKLEPKHLRKFIEYDETKMESYKSNIEQEHNDIEGISSKALESYIASLSRRETMKIEIEKAELEEKAAFAKARQNSAERKRRKKKDSRDNRHKKDIRYEDDDYDGTERLDIPRDHEISRDALYNGRSKKHGHHGRHIRDRSMKSINPEERNEEFSQERINGVNNYETSHHISEESGKNHEDDYRGHTDEFKESHENLMLNESSKYDMTKDPSVQVIVKEASVQNLQNEDKQSKHRSRQTSRNPSRSVSRNPSRTVTRNQLITTEKNPLNIEITQNITNSHLVSGELEFKPINKEPSKINVQTSEANNLIGIPQIQPKHSTTKIQFEDVKNVNNPTDSVFMLEIKPMKGPDEEMEDFYKDISEGESPEPFHANDFGLIQHEESLESPKFGRKVTASPRDDYSPEYSPSIDIEKIETDIEELKKNIEKINLDIAVVKQLTIDSTKIYEDSAQKSSEALAKFQMSLESNLGLLHEEMKQQVLRNKQDKIDLGKQMTLYHAEQRANTLTLEKIDQQISSINELLMSLAEIGKILYVLISQEEEDRQSLQLIGYSEAKVQKPYISLKADCMSCSGQNPTILNAFKMACLNYMPSSVKYRHRAYTRKQLIGILGSVTNSSWNQATNRSPRFSSELGSYQTIPTPIEEKLVQSSKNHRYNRSQFIDLPSLNTSKVFIESTDTFVSSTREIKSKHNI